MNIVRRMGAKLSNIYCCFRMKGSVVLYSSAFHTSNQSSFRLSLADLRYAFDSIRNIDEAVALFHYMLQMNPNPTICDYNKLFRTIVKMEDYTQVILMFKKMTLLARPVDDYTMATLVNCYCHLKEVDLSFGIIAAFLKRGYAPDIVTFNCLIKGFFLKGKIAEAVDLFKNLIKGKSYEVDKITTLTMLYGLSKSGNVGDAVDLLQLTEKNNWEVDVCGYTAVIDGLCKAGMLKEGIELLFRMVDNGKIPDVVSYSCLMHGLCMNGKLDFACDIFNDLPSKGICPDVFIYTVMIQGLCRKHLFRDAKELLEKMEQVGCLPDDVTYRVILRGCLHRRDNFDSINLLKQIVGRDFQLDATSFFMLLRQIQVLRQKKGVYDDEVIYQLIQKLLSNSAKYQMGGRGYAYKISSLAHKLSSSDSRYSLS